MIFANELPIDCSGIIEASLDGKYEVIKSFVDKGCDLNNIDADGRTPLMSAIKNKHDKIAELLIKSGALLDVQDHKGFTALIHAAFSGSADTAQLLVDRGADINIKSNKGAVALFYAGMSKQQNIVRILREAKRKAQDPNR